MPDFLAGLAGVFTPAVCVSILCLTGTVLMIVGVVTAWRWRLRLARRLLGAMVLNTVLLAAVVAWQKL